MSISNISVVLQKKEVNMNKFFISVIVVILNLFLFQQHITAQDFEQQFLPDGAMKRLGKGWIRDIKFSNDGNQFAVATTIGIWIYDSRTGNLMNRIEGYMGGANAISYSNDSQLLAAAHDDFTIRLWKPNKLIQDENILVLRGHTRKIHNVQFSPDGTMIASAGADKSIRLWNPKGKNDREIHLSILPYKSVVRGITFSPDSQLLAGGSEDGTIQVWDTGTGDLIYNYKGHNESVQALDFSTDRTELISASLDGSVLFWNLVGEGAEKRSTLQHNSSVYAVKFSPDGNSVATGAADRIIRIWDKNSTEKNIPFIGHNDIVSNVDYSPNGNAVISGSLDGKVLLWDMVGARSRFEITGHTGGIKTLSYTEDNRIRACGSGLDGKLRIWDAGTSSALSILREHIGLTETVIFSKDSKIIASGGGYDGTIFLSDVGKVLESREGFSDDSLLTILSGNTHGITALAFAPGNTTLATGGVDGRIYLFDVHSKQVMKILRGPQSTITALTFMNDSTRLFSGEENGIIRQWNGLSGEEIGTGLNVSFGAITALTYSSTHKFLVIGNNKGKIQFYSPHNGNKNTLEFQTPHRSMISALIVSKDGNTLVSGSENGTIILWDMRKVQNSPEEAVKALPKDLVFDEKKPANKGQNTILTAQEIARKTRESTVYLRTLNANGDAIGTGSGFFIDTGLIATNFHVIDGSSSIFVRVVDKEKWYYIEEIAAVDKSHDLVILKVSRIDTPVLSLANSDTIEIGETVYAMGNPQGWEGTFSEGIISSIRGENSNKWIQITAPVSPGSSGGAILNKSGEVIGIATLAYFSIDPKLKVNRSQNINFAVPSNYLKKLLQKVKQPTTK